MQCTFCGMENRSEYKFCGMCGVRLERRHAERRTMQSGVSTKCASCGHLNEPGLKFCGMCGSRIERRMQERRGSEGEQTRAKATANAQLPTPEGSGRRKPDTVLASSSHPDIPPAGPRRDEPAIFRTGPNNGSNISGPSFLGLNSQPEGGDGEYLLEDEPTGRGLRRFILLLIIMAIAGLIFVQWRSSFKASPKPPPPKVEPATPSSPQGSNQPGAPGNADPTSKDGAAADNKNDSNASANDVK